MNYIKLYIRGLGVIAIYVIFIGGMMAILLGPLFLGHALNNKFWNLLYLTYLPLLFGKLWEKTD